MPLSPRQADRILRRKVEARKRMLDEIRFFTERIVRDFGTVQLQDEHDDYIHIMSRLQGFAGFTFHLDAGQNMFDRTEIKIWHHPKTDRLMGQAAVLEMHWEQEYRSVYTYKDLTWQRALLQLIHNPESVARYAKEFRDAHPAQHNPSLWEESERRKLYEEARRLGI